ncbi:hypothetical protein VPH35_075385 [Triticum aestivum]|uniref:acetylserotonin O-methyltransferase 3-like n=1 Tax=Triticum aestivum TaxID=4565 RepID=UPI000843F0CD|nr:acetylserotonin O-methyltransferase 3-like [Triticum aestivum]
MSLKCAVDLGIPGSIHRRGGTATLANTKVHPARLADLRRVMELLSASGIFSATACATDGTAAEVQYGMTTACRFLVGWRNLSPVAQPDHSELFLEVILLDKGRIFRGLSSLVDVGGGNGAGTRVMAKAFPRIKCDVLDLPHVVGQAAGDHGNLRIVAEHHA